VLFPLCQANYRFATETCGLTIPYREDAEVQGLLRRVWALAFIPIISIALNFSELKQEGCCTTEY